MSVVDWGLPDRLEAKRAHERPLRHALGRSVAIADEGHGYDVFGANAASVRRAEAVTKVFYDKWFRVESKGSHHVPRDGPAILVANHGGTLPIDAVMLWTDVIGRTGRLLRPVADHFVLRLPFVGTLSARTGSIGGTRGNVRRALSRGELLLIFPEGLRGIAKGIQHRYELADFRVGHAELAIRHRAPIIPAAVIGAEEQLPSVGHLPIHWFGIPYVPIPLTLLPLPVRYHIHYGEPIALHEEYSPEEADYPEVLVRASERVKNAVRVLVDRGLRERRGIFR